MEVKRRKERALVSKGSSDETKKNEREERSEKESERGQRNSFFLSGRDRRKKGTVITKVVCGQMFGKGKNAKTINTSNTQKGMV